MNNHETLVGKETLVEKETGDGISHEGMRCRECGSFEVSRHRRWVGMFVGPILIVVGFVLFLATLGFSFVISLYGVFLMLPKFRCQACGAQGRFYDLHALKRDEKVIVNLEGKKG